MINTYYWATNNNFGDMLVPIIMKGMFNIETKLVNSTTPNKYLIIGSELPKTYILQPGDIIWGYGTRYNEDIKLHKSNKILALRGKITRSYIKEDIGEVAYGDPATFMPQIYTPKTLNEHYDIGIIPHHKDITSGIFTNIKDKNIFVFDVRKNPYEIIDKINCCDLIVSSSLHGCIIAESYGKPVVWGLGYYAEEEGFEVKFNDYFSSSGRPSDIVPNKFKEYNIKSIIELSKNPLPKAVINTKPLYDAWINYHK